MGGQLLSLENVPQVKAALSSSMLGNVESDYRIDGWSAATWFEGENNSISEYVSVVPDMTSATLTMSLEDGLNHAAEQNALARATEDCQKGIANFLNKQQ